MRPNTLFLVFCFIPRGSNVRRFGKGSALRQVVNEKKMRREMSGYRVLELFSHIVAFGCIIAGLYVLNNPRSPGASDNGVWIAVALFVLNPILFSVGLLALLVRRQTEHALYFKELITAQKGQLSSDASSDASLRKAA